MAHFVRNLCGRVVYVSIALLLLCSLSVEAALLVNEVQPWSGSPGGEGEAQPAMIEFFNTGPLVDSLGLREVRLQSPEGAFSFDLPAWIIPPRCYLSVYLAVGTNDGDFSDSAGTYYAGEVGPLAWTAGEIGLYRTSPLQIQDFVNWGIGTSTFGAAYGDAVVATIWTAGSFVDVGAYGQFSHLARTPSGWDTNIPGNWQEATWDIVVGLTPHNSMQISPRDGVLLPSVTTLSWKPIPGVSVYTIEVDDDSNFTSLVVSQAVFFSTNTPITVPDGVYYWRVIPNLPGGPYPPAPWMFAQGVPSARLLGESAVPQRLQHKDTQLLCIWYLGSGVNTRPGCTETAGAQGPWDAEHSQDSTHIVNCHHCNQYCARASIQMVNAKFGGSLTQDEISYNMMQGKVAGPEGDLGHDRPAQHAQGDYGAYSWALMGAATPVFFQASGPFPWAVLVAQITADRPILAAIEPGHAVVYNGYLEFFGHQFCHIMNPWPGSTGWRLLNRVNCYRYYTLPAGAISGRATDANVTADADGDGVMNFDEQHPDPAGGQVARPFCSLWDDPDTEDDEVRDKQEIRSYTFHDSDHGGHENDPLTFPDIDGDGLRQECDCDGDNDSDFDGGEDINGDGRNPVGGLETCEYNADHLINCGVILFPGPYLCTEEVWLWGLTYHEFSWYPYEIISPCPAPIDGQALGWNGIVFSIANGIIPLQYIGTYGPGIYRVVVDVLRDHLYSEPDNWDPWTCWGIPPHCYLTLDVPDPTTTADWYNVVLDSLNIQYTPYIVPPGADGPTITDYGSYPVMIWVTGDSPPFNCITPNDAMNLMQYLDQGGKLLITGDNIGTEVVEFPDPMRQQFYEQYLGAQYNQEFPFCQVGVTQNGTFLQPPVTFQTRGVGGANYPQYSPDDVNLMNGTGSFAAARWTPSCPSSAGVNVIGRENPTTGSRTAYYSFPWENITNLSARVSLLDKTLDWLYGTPAELSPVTDLTIQVANGSMTLHWTPVPGALAYEIHAGDDPDFIPSDATQIGISDVGSFNFTGFLELNEKWFTVIATGPSFGGGQNGLTADLQKWIATQTDLDAVQRELDARKVKYRMFKSETPH